MSNELITTASTDLTTTTTDPRILALVAMVLNDLQSDHTKRDYRRALNDFMAWYAASGHTALSKAVVNAYKTQLQAQGMGNSSINQRLSAIRKLAREAADNGLIDDRAAQGITNVVGIAHRGERAGNWLTAAEAEQLINAPDDTTLKGKRDRALLAVLIGCGLRRDELARLTRDHIQQREGRWVIVDLIGKRAKLRSIPMAAWIKSLIDRWTDAAGIAAGPVFVYVTRGPGGTVKGEKGDATTSQSIMRAVVKYGMAIGKPALRPHDLRRTFAKLARAAGAPLEQIQINLGHESLTTTQKYLGSQLDYQNTPSDLIKLNVRLRA